MSAVARKRVERLMVQRFDGTTLSGRAPDRIVVEEPLEIRLDDVTVATTMRTPGHDFELAAGFCHTDGLLAGSSPVDVRYCALGPASDSEWNVVSVSSGGVASEPTPRLGTVTSACGWCGTATIDDLATTWPALDPIDVDERALAVMAEVGERAAADQELFELTGGTHAAAAFDLRDGAILAVREDIGRHNAADKVVGRLLLDGRLPADGLGLWMSSRLGHEIVAKAWAAGFAVVVSVGPASSLAVRTAKRAGITAAGFARDGRLVRYC